MSDTISAAITAARATAGATRDEVVTGAREAGAPESFTVAALRNVESGRRSPSAPELVWIASALKVAPRELLGDLADAFGRAAVSAGPVEEAARRAVEELDELDARGQALAESAYALARALDAGGLSSPAPVARELRATLALIWEGQVEGDDQDDFGPE